MWYSKDEMIDLVNKSSKAFQVEGILKSTFILRLYMAINVGTFVLPWSLWRPSYVRVDSVYLQFVAYNAQPFGY